MPGPVYCLVMPFRDEAAHLSAVLDAVAAQTIGHERLRLIAVDNGSSDGGADVVRRWAARVGIRTQIVRVERPSIPSALNAGIAEARADEYVVRLDAHTVYGATYLACIERAFEQLPQDAWWVGGSPGTLSGEGNLGRALVASLMMNPLGLGGAAWRSGSVLREVESAYLGAWRPGVLARIGGFDPHWRANEDGELGARIRAYGGTVWFAPLPCRYRITRGPIRTLAQWRRYGFWRARTILRHRSTLRLRHLAPPAEVVLGLTLACSPLRIALLPLALLFAALLIARRPAGESPLVTAAAIAYFPLAHAAFAIGLAGGLMTGLLVDRTAAWTTRPLAAVPKER